MNRRICLFLLCGLLVSGCQQTMPSSSVEESASEIPAETESTEEEVIRLSIASASSFDSLTGTILAECANEWEQNSEGRVHVDLYGGSVLGDDALLSQAVTKGTVSIVMMDITLYADIVPESSLPGIPFTFNSLEEYSAMMNGDYGEIFCSYFEREGLKLIANYAASWKYISSNIPLETAEDLSRLNIRIVDNPLRQLYWQSCGATTGFQAFSELYMALRNGLFNAQENSMEAVYANRLYEVQDYVLNTKHLPTIHSFVMNLEQYNALPEDVQEGLNTFARHFSGRYLAKVSHLDEEYWDLLEKRGDIIRLELTPELRQAFMDAREPLIQSLTESLGEETVGQYLAAAEAITSKK